jgi:hypothetical protein
MDREDFMVSPALRLASRILKTNEVCWRRRDILGACQELANKSIVILGFDILAFEGEDGAVRIWGTSAYDMEGCLRSRPWNDCVKVALEAARHDIERTPDLSGYPGNPNDLWYCVTTLRFGEPIYPPNK